MTSDLTDGIDSLSKKKKIESGRKRICCENGRYFNVSTPVGGRRDKNRVIDMLNRLKVFECFSWFPSVSIRIFA